MSLLFYYFLRNLSLLFPKIDCSSLNACQFIVPYPIFKWKLNIFSHTHLFSLSKCVSFCFYSFLFHIILSLSSRDRIVFYFRKKTLQFKIFYRYENEILRLKCLRKREVLKKTAEKLLSYHFWTGSVVRDSPPNITFFWRSDLWKQTLSFCMVFITFLRVKSSAL